ncbi:MAG: HDIG domain-containing protein [Clostridia bacterium]|nr:HDIG domain-containing protein [Clostridia bacterium]
MDRQQAVAYVKKHLKNKNLFKHVLATEAIMKKLAEDLNEDTEKWALAGLLHDIDYEKTAKDARQHSLLGAKMLEEQGISPDIVYAVRVHNEIHGLERKTNMDKALYCADPTTGLIVAAALISPNKKLSDIDVDFIIRRFGEKAFARGANREQIKSCSELGYSLEEFIGLSLEAMREISEDLGL